MERLTEFFTQTKTLWNNLDSKARMIIVSSALLVFAGLIILIFWVGQPQMVPLYSDLSSTDAAGIVSLLEEQNIPYELASGGSTILVPQEEVYRVRLDMAESGLPKGGVVGFEIFDQSNFGATDFERRVQYYRALGGELARTISRLDAVDMAVVQVSPPEDSVFIKDTRKAEASVLLKLSPMAQLEASQVEAITNLVASSVPDLSPEDVTVVDTEGNLLNQLVSGSESISSGSYTVSRLELQRQFESQLEGDLQQLLTRVLGPKNVVVNVRAELNMDQREVTSTTYEPVVDDQGIVKNEEVTEEQYTGNPGSTPQGVPGTESNVPTYQGTETGGGDYQREERITNYEINKKIENHIYAPGEIEKLSVAVVVNKELNEDQQNQIFDMVSAAVGYDPDRGDSLSISQMSFDTSLEREMVSAQQELQAADFRRNLLYIGLGIAGLILLYFIARRFTAGFAGIPAEQGSAGARGQVFDMMADESAEEQAAALDDLKPSAADKLRQELKTEIKEIITEKPDEVANLLKAWLLDDE
ncbi:MAG: flagellar basal-body MS-ring/collar protein FliF [Halanaerobium sp.]|nr:flagellar basal-body MS-ring/collar protein FliF [Halanaerobium sp.]